jgi:hypothetical protein
MKQQLARLDASTPAVRGPARSLWPNLPPSNLLHKYPRSRVSYRSIFSHPWLYMLTILSHTSSRLLPPEPREVSDFSYHQDPGWRDDPLQGITSSLGAMYTSQGKICPSVRPPRRTNFVQSHMATEPHNTVTPSFKLSRPKKLLICLWPLGDCNWVADDEELL